jgi:hypothetical protein
MSEDNYTVSYLKCQETFLIDVMRRCLDAESKISILQNDISKKDAVIEVHLNRINELNEHLMQAVAGLEATTIARDTYRDEHAKYRDEILALGDLKEKCEKIEKNYEEHMKNYNLVNEAYQNLQVEYEKLARSTKKTKPDQTKKDDWE